jgi:catechol 2,3-dioxygenase-like lactoylglutathione lyase family enzyme
VLERFLELSMPATDVASALAFYESLGFVQAAVGEAWPHAYAVVTDGRMYFGLHGIELDAPRLAFVAPRLREQVATLAERGLELEYSRLDELSLNEVEFRDPTGVCVRLLEARTFSPPSLEPGLESELGYCEGCVIGTRDVDAAGRFWEALGFVAFATGDDDGEPRALVASHRDLNLLFQDVDVEGPVPCLTAPDMAARIARLRDRGFSFARHVPRAFERREGAMLRALDGFQVLLLGPDS